jgi:hypothetical protein
MARIVLLRHAHSVANEKNIFHSEYILRQCKMFELISNEPTKPFNEHDIKEYNV